MLKKRSIYFQFGSWDLGYDMDKWLEMAMHLVGHGVISSILELTELVLTEHSLWTRFRDFANTFLEDIASLRLAWCHIKTLPKAN